MIDYVTEEKRAKCAKKGSTRKAVFRLEGETVGYAEIAKRLGISKDAATNRMRRLRYASGPITWGRLQGIRE